MLQALPLFLLLLQLFDFTKVVNLFLKFIFYNKTIFYQVLCFLKAQNKQNKWPQKRNHWLQVGIHGTTCLVQHVMMEETTNLMKPSTFASCILHKAFNEIGWCITNDWSDVTIIFRHANCKFANFGIDFAHKCICYTFHCQNHFHCCAPLSTTHHHPKPHQCQWLHMEHFNMS